MDLLVCVLLFKRMDGVIIEEEEEEEGGGSEEEREEEEERATWGGHHPWRNKGIAFDPIPSKVPI